MAGQGRDYRKVNGFKGGFPKFRTRPVTFVLCARCCAKVPSNTAPGIKGAVYCDDCLKDILDGQQAVVERRQKLRGLQKQAEEDHRLRLVDAKRLAGSNNIKK